MNTDLMRAILAMDSYNHGYDESVNSLGGVGERIGNAKIVMQSNADLTSDERKAGFYAIAYDTNGDGKADVISYRGTDDLVGSDSDIGNGWLLVGGN